MVQKVKQLGCTEHVNVLITHLHTKSNPMNIITQDLPEQNHSPCQALNKCPGQSSQSRGLLLAFEIRDR